MISMKTLSIPWDFRDGETIKVWRWETEHFDAEIKSDDTRFFYMVVDKAGGSRKPILDGIAMSNKEAEAAILDMVGKAYPLKLGYRKYAGHYATTFRIYTGQNVDFGELEGRKVAVEAKDRTGAKKIYSGLLQVSHFSILVTTDSGKKTKIPPAFITDIRAEMSNNDAQRIGTGRTVRGEPLQGCTGTAGFMKGIVDHGISAPFCPIHQV